MCRIPAALFLLAFAFAAVALRTTAPAAEKASADDAGPRLGEAHVQKWKFGMVVTASGGNVGRLSGTTTIPIQWPEQGLRLVAKDLSPGVAVTYKDYGTAKQMIVSIPRVADGKSVRRAADCGGHAAHAASPGEH